MLNLLDHRVRLTAVSALTVALAGVAAVPADAHERGHTRSGPSQHSGTVTAT